ncbi:hypothetical protein [Agrococcus sp. Marseille-P2731]|uniref:hypothetical protein n=1 Tax=Agrococcus sp. Marseille-P2731 TaxID=1841862 RepID=UPI000930BCD4|nr:hypothetical protein [Agrococcus sp. Marseille-P2731]
MTDAYQPNDPLARPTGTPPEADAVFAAPTVPAAGEPFSTGTTGPSGSSSSSGVKDTAKEEAANLGSSAKDAGQRVAGTAKDEAKNVAGEAKHQAKQLLDTTMQEAREQASTQQRRAAEGMRTVSDDLRSMASGEGASDGIAQQIVTQVGDRVEAAAGWLNDREPADLLDELKSFARRRPGTFIAIAGVAGLLVGRLTRGLIADAKDEHGSSSTTGGSGYPSSGGAHAAGGSSTDGYSSSTPGTGGYSTGSAGTVGGAGAGPGVVTDVPGTGYAAGSGVPTAGDNEPWTGDTVPGDMPGGPSTGTRPEERGL